MTLHCYSNWTLDDPIEDAPIEQIVTSVKDQLSFPYMCFAILNVGDSFAWNLPKLIQSNRGKILDQQLIESFVPEDTKHRDKVIKIIVDVFTKLDLYGKMQEAPEPTKIEFTHISVPKINEPYPTL